MTAEKKYLKVSFKKIPCSIFKEILKSNIYTNDEDSVKKKKIQFMKNSYFLLETYQYFVHFIFPLALQNWDTR